MNRSDIIKHNNTDSKTRYNQLPYHIWVYYSTVYNDRLVAKGLKYL